MINRFFIALLTTLAMCSGACVRVAEFEPTAPVAPIQPNTPPAPHKFGFANAGVPGVVSATVALSDGTNVASFTSGGALNVTGTATPASGTIHLYNGTISASIKASSGVLYAFHCNSRSSTIDWIQLFNSTSAPAGSATAYYQFLLPAGGEVIAGHDFFAGGWTLGTGVAYGISSVTGTYTADTAANFDCAFEVQ